MKKYLWILPVLVLLLAVESQAAVITVTTDTDIEADDGVCSLREAVKAAGSHIASGASAGECIAGDDSPAVRNSIIFKMNFPATIFLDAPLAVNAANGMDIYGPGIDKLTVYAVQTQALSVAGDSFVFSGFTLRGGWNNGFGEGGALHIEGANSVTLRGMRFTDSVAINGGAVFAKLVDGQSLTINSCSFTNNLAWGQAVPGRGGALSLNMQGTAQADIKNSTFSANRADGIMTQLIQVWVDGILTDKWEKVYNGFGGAIYLEGDTVNSQIEGSVSIMRSSFSGNFAGWDGAAIAGGGFAKIYDGDLDIAHTTIHANLVGEANPDISVAIDGASLFVATTYSGQISGHTGLGSLTLFNSIVSGTTKESSGLDSRDLRLFMRADQLSNKSYNIVGNNEGVDSFIPFGQPNPQNSWVGNIVQGIQDPQLESLTGQYGGLTEIMMPVGHLSPAVDNGRCPGENRDQRDFSNQATGSRPVDEPNASNGPGGFCDIGSVEYAADDTSNFAPSLLPETYHLAVNTALQTTDADGSLSIAVTEDDGLLANDVDLDGDGLSIVNTGAHALGSGTLTLAADGTFSFTGHNTETVLTFVYTVTDGSINKTQTMSIDLIPPPPPVNVDDSYTTTVDTALTTTDEYGLLTADTNDNGVLANDNDAVQPQFRLEDNLSSPNYGSIRVGGIGGSFVAPQLSPGINNGLFTYTPPSGVSGIATVEYKSRRATTLLQGAEYSTITITVEPATPTAAVDDSYTVAYNSILNANDANGSDPATDNDNGVLANDLNTPTLTTAGTFTASPLGGTVVLAADGTFTYTPSGATQGTDEFQYTVDDNGNSSTATVSIEVTSPVGIADNYVIDEDGSLTANDISGSNGSSNDDGVLVNDNPAGAATVVTTGSFTLNGIGGSLEMAADGSFVYTPPADKSGTDTMNYTLQDNNGQHSAKLSISVNPVNDAPSFTPGNSISVPQNSGVSIFPNWATDISAGPYEFDTLIFILTPGTITGNLAFASTPTITADGTLSIEPTAGTSGSVVVTVVLQDSSLSSSAAHFTISVGTNNTAPTAVADNYSMNEDELLYVNGIGGVKLLSNDTDAEGNSLQVSTTGAQTAGGIGGNAWLFADGKFYYQPPADAFGTAILTYKVSDGALESNTATITIDVVEKNDKPQAQDDQINTVLEDAILPVIPAAALLVNDSAGPNESNQVLQVAAVGQEQGGSALLNGTDIQFTLQENFNGNALFRYQVVDDGTTEGFSDPKIARAWAGYVVTPVNDAPTFTPAATSINLLQQYTANAQSSLWATNISPGAANESSQQVSFNLVSSIQSGTLAFDVAPSLDTSGNLSFTLTSGTWGEALLTISAKDDGGTANGGVDQSADVQLSLVVARLDSDGDGIPDDLDQDICSNSLLHIYAGDNFSGIGNTTLSTTSEIDTDTSGIAEVLSPHRLILKAPQVVIKTGINFRVEDGGLLQIFSQADVCP